jgi:Niemann-Pick C1 protein
MNVSGRGEAGASYFMAYHSILKTSEDYYSALREARNIADNLTRTIQEKTGTQDVQVFPYRLVGYNYSTQVVILGTVLTHAKFLIH